MIDALEPPNDARHFLYRVVRWGLRVYFVSLLVASVYSLLWVFEIAGVLPRGLLSTIWIGIAAMGTVFLALLVPLFYTTRPGSR
ncbi:hypothetical protein ACFQGT_10055 [Natrialbaceae archaeon GCM10025810]|uniref:hypothetical protein n=1 Tax=Halovalidus salilacus TaxID=3075124 RepID=UPI003622DBE0